MLSNHPGNSAASRGAATSFSWLFTYYPGTSKKEAGSQGRARAGEGALPAGLGSAFDSLGFLSETLSLLLCGLSFLT